MKTIKNLSSRTVTKILLHLNLGCFECGWCECICDIHHIQPKKKGGSDAMNNLTYLCPNCHRKAHNGLLTTFKSLEDVLGETWEEVYNPKTPSSKPEKARAARHEKCQNVAKSKIAALLAAGVTCSQPNWLHTAAAILEINTGSVRRFLRKYHPDFFKVD